jgi:hypothetical protein
MVLENDGVDQLDQSCVRNEKVLCAVREERNIVHAVKKKEG